MDAVLIGPFRTDSIEHKGAFAKVSSDLRCLTQSYPAMPGSRSLKKCFQQVDSNRRTKCAHEGAMSSAHLASTKEEQMAHKSWQISSPFQH